MQLRAQRERVEDLVDDVVQSYHNGFNKAIHNYSRILRLFSESKDQVKRTPSRHSHSRHDDALASHSKIHTVCCATDSYCRGTQRLALWSTQAGDSENSERLRKMLTETGIPSPSPVHARR